MNEGLDIHKDSNQIIVENNFFSENSHTAFYVNHSSNILYNRNLTICTGEKPIWADQQVNHGETDNLGTAITFRNESSESNENRAYGGNHAIINNIVMGCTSHLIITPQVRKDAQGNPKPVRPMGSHLVAFNTFIDARKGGFPDPKEADFMQFLTNASYYGESIVVQNNLFKFDDTRAKLINQPSAASISTIIFATNLTNQTPSFNEGMSLASLPFEAAYNSTSFLGDNPRPWNLTKTQLDNILKRAMLDDNSSAINAAEPGLPTSITSSDRERFLNLYEGYLHRDYFDNVRGTNPDVGAHEFGGVPGPTFTPAPTPTDGPPPTGGDQVVDWDLDNDSDVDVFDFNRYLRKIIRNQDTWSKLAGFIEAFRAQ